MGVVSDCCLFRVFRIPGCVSQLISPSLLLILARSFSFIRYLSLLLCWFLFSVCYKYCLPELKYTFYTYFVSFTCFIFVCIDFGSFLLVSAVVLMEFLTFACRYLCYLFFLFFSNNGIFLFHLQIFQRLSMFLYRSNQFQSQEPLFVCFTYKLSRGKTRSNAHCEWRKNAFHHLLLFIFKVLPLLKVCLSRFRYLSKCYFQIGWISRPKQPSDGWQHFFCHIERQWNFVSVKIRSF